VTVPAPRGLTSSLEFTTTCCLLAPAQDTLDDAPHASLSALKRYHQSPEMATSEPAHADERSPLLQSRAAAPKDHFEDPTKLPKGQRNAILVSVWIGVFVSAPCLLRRREIRVGKGGLTSAAPRSSAPSTARS